MTRRVLVFLLISLLPGHQVFAEWVTLPGGTVVYGEILETVTSRKKETSEGDLVQAVVWRDVSVKGQVAIEAGTPLVVKVDKVKKANFAGVKGKLELRAFSATAVDGTHVPLVGGYDKSGRGKKALSISLAAIVFLPLIFIKGKQAVLEPGTIFDAQVQGSTDLEVGAEAPGGTLRLGGRESLEVEILYDDVPEKGKVKFLPMRLELCGEPAESAQIVAVNGEDIEPIGVELLDRTADADCVSARGQASIEELGKHFKRGINRFDVQFGSVRTELVMEVEL